MQPPKAGMQGKAEGSGSRKREDCFPQAGGKGGGEGLSGLRTLNSELYIWGTP